MRLACVPGSRISIAPAAAGGLFLALCLGFLITGGEGAIAAGDGQETGSGTIRFDIPSLPLGAALEIYARVAGREVLYDGALAAGHRSSPVAGLYAPVGALQILLAGTGLQARFEDADFFVLVPVPAGRPAQAAMPPAASQPAAQQRYYGRLQARLRAAFCRNSAVLPGGYRIAARLWIGASGEVLQEKRLASTGNAGLDRDLDAVLGGLTLDAPPPAGFAQPVTIVVMPNEPGVRQDCGDGSAPPLPELPVGAGPRVEPRVGP